MNENRRAAAQPETLKQSARTKLTETFHKQKSATASANKRKVVLSEQTASSINQSQAALAASTAGAADKDTKKVAKVEIPVSLDIDPFGTEGFKSPQNALDKMLSAKGMVTAGLGTESARAKSDDVLSLEHSKGAAATTLGAANESEAATLSTLRALVKKSETDLLTLKHQLLETKAELKAAEDRLREKDAIIKEQEARIDELIESRVPLDDMNDIMEENARLRQELKENETLLSECQQLLEEYVANEK
ncbi:hypothetical protein J3B02_000062 [Coemansia erecta]|uniref:Uncharacterized protein n=1 Tax=Coemansia asiatica TaxID=1052880 RepID=A0A9W7XIQ7_9FUNG|nr:hypothetical protein LPJ64_004651 [Coemansia asiatica]KAJ2858681.1 hypothetical protein J3B02_000062 [Coemansia erecta]KAJ2867972.1 hypothetical protein FB639_004901 [Coemansia asiatica]